MEFELECSTLGWRKFDKTSKDGKPKASGSYLVWYQGAPTISEWSAKYQGWGICLNGNRDFELEDVEYFSAILPPIL